MARLDFLLPFIILIATIFKLINSRLSERETTESSRLLESFFCLHDAHASIKPVANELFSFYLFAVLLN